MIDTGKMKNLAREDIQTIPSVTMSIAQKVAQTGVKKIKSVCIYGKPEERGK